MTLILWWVTCLIWSSVWLFIKLGLRDLPPVSFAAIRLVVAIAVFLPILAIRRSPLPRHARDWYVIGVAGERMSATALLSMTLVEPLIAVLLGAVLLHERVTPGAAAGGALVLSSIFMITISFRRSRT